MIAGNLLSTGVPWNAWVQHDMLFYAFLIPSLCRQSGLNPSINPNNIDSPALVCTLGLDTRKKQSVCAWPGCLHDSPFFQLLECFNLLWQSLSITAIRCDPVGPLFVTGVVLGRSMKHPRVTVAETEPQPEVIISRHKPSKPKTSRAAQKYTSTASISP